MELEESQIKFLIKYANLKIHNETSPKIKDNVLDSLQNKLKTEYFSVSQKLLSESFKLNENQQEAVKKVNKGLMSDDEFTEAKRRMKHKPIEENIEKYFKQLKEEINDLKKFVDSNKLNETSVLMYNKKVALYNKSISQYLQGSFDDDSNDNVLINELSIEGFKDKSIFNDRINKLIKKIKLGSEKEIIKALDLMENKSVKLTDKLFNPVLLKICKFYDQRIKIIAKVKNKGSDVNEVIRLFEKMNLNE